jgi:hypothetical protein
VGSDSVWQIVKIAILFLCFFYIIFSLIVAKQVKVMTETLEIGFEKEISLIAKIHLVVAVAFFVAALIIL